MGYIYVEKDGVQAQYLITSTANEPRLCVNSTGYIPLVMGTTNAPMLKYAPADGYETLRAGSYTSTTVKSTSSSVGSSSVGCAGTSSSSGSTLNSTIQASTAISFTSTSAFTRSSTSGYNGLSNAAAQTCSSTSSWAGSSTKQSNYQTTLANSVGLSSSTALTRESIYGYEDCVSTTGWDYPQAYKATRTWYHTLNRTTGYSGYTAGYAWIGNASMTLYGHYASYGDWHDKVAYYMTIRDNLNGTFPPDSIKFKNGVGWVDLNRTNFNYGTRWVRYDNGYFWVNDDAYAEDVDLKGYYGTQSGNFSAVEVWKGERYTRFTTTLSFLGYGNYYYGGFHIFTTDEYGGQTYNAVGDVYAKQTNYYSSIASDGMSEVTALTEDYLDYGNPQYVYDWVVTNTVARTCRVTTRTLTRESISSWKGISSRQSYYQTTLANSAGLSSVTALTRSSTSAYSGVSCSRSDYYGTQVNSNGMTNATAMTRESIYGYSGVTSRSSPYNTTSNAVGNLSYATALTRESVYGYSGLSTSSCTYNLAQTSRTITRVNIAAFTHDTSHMENEWLGHVYPIAGSSTINGRWASVYRIGNDGYRKEDRYLPEDQYGRTWNYVWEEYDDAGAQIGSTKFRMSNSRDYVYDYGTHPIADGYSYSGTWSTGYADDSWGRTLYFLVSARTGYRTSSSEAACYVTSPSAAGLSNITNLTRASVSGYSGQLSQQSNYYVTKENSAGLSNVTTLTRSSTSGYTGVLSRTSSYETLIPNDGQNALVAQALTCSSTSEWGGKSSTSESISSTELRTSYFTSGYTESTTISVTDRVLTTTVYSDTITVQSSSLSSGNGYKIVGGAIVVDQGGYAYYTIESFSTYGQSTYVVVAESTETTTLRTGTYTRTSQAIMSYGARTSLSTYINTNTYIETIWGYM